MCFRSLTCCLLALASVAARNTKNSWSSFLDYSTSSLIDMQNSRYQTLQSSSVKKKKKQTERLVRQRMHMGYDGVKAKQGTDEGLRQGNAAPSDSKDIYTESKMDHRLKTGRSKMYEESEAKPKHGTCMSKE